MATNNSKTASGMTSRTKLTIGLMVIVVIILIWQLSGLFGGSAPSKPSVATNTNGIITQPGIANPAPQMVTPKVVNVMPQPSSLQEPELNRIQQESQARYLQAVNELQVLKVAKEIAFTNRDISTAKLTQVLAEKKIVDTLVPPAPPQPTVDVTKSVVPVISVPSTIDQEVTYTVVSISQLQHEWAAVLNYKGSLYNIHVGDVLPPDGSLVSAIKRDGVVLQKDGVKKKLSLVAPI